jgi:hypothetical protein
METPSLFGITSEMLTELFVIVLDVSGVARVPASVILTGVLREYT